MSARCDNCKRVTESICSHVEGRTWDDTPIYSCVVKYLDDPEDTKSSKLNPEWIKAYGNEKLQLILKTTINFRRAGMLYSILRSLP